MNTSSKGPVRHGPYPELTWQAVIVGYVLGSIIAIAIGYAALILGFSVEGSELAAILGWGILRGVMKRTSIVENNINQTIASAVNGASAGIMFTVPALFILYGNKSKAASGLFGFVQHVEASSFIEFSIPLMVLSCVAGGILGLCFVIPLRKQMIDFNRLAYPGGIAVATILKSPGAGIQKAKLLGGGALIAALAHLPVLLTHTEYYGLGEALGLPQFLNISFYLSLLTVGVGFLSGRGGLVFGAGGFIVYFLLSPLLYKFASPEVATMAADKFSTLAVDPRLPASLATGQSFTLVLAGNAASLLRYHLFKPAGIGILIGAAVGGIIAAFPLIRSAFKSMQDAAKEKSADGRTLADELPINLLYAGIVVGALALTAIAYFTAKEMTLLRALGMATLGTIWIWVAGVIVSECLGRTNWNPLSGMTLIAVTILILIASGMSKPAVFVASMMIGVAICIAIAQAGDMMLDLKSGYLVGASPKQQQIGQFLATWLGPIVVIGLLFVLHNAYGFGSTKLPAPQAAALAGVMEALTGGDIAWYRYLAGAGLGAMLAFSGLGGIGVMIGLGFYMPFDIVLTYTIGCGLRIAADKYRGTLWVEGTGVPIAAGLIVGEALVGVGNALFHIIRRIV